MTIKTNFSKQLISLVCTAGITTLGIGNEAFAQDQESVSPRAYCLQTGGIVSETNDPDVYLCLYHSKGKGLVVNTADSQSLLVELPTTYSKVAQLTTDAFDKWIVPINL